MIEVGDYSNYMLAHEQSGLPIMIHKSMGKFAWSDKWKRADYRIGDVYRSSLGYSLKTLYSLSGNGEDIYIAVGSPLSDGWSDEIRAIGNLYRKRPSNNIYIHCVNNLGIKKLASAGYGDVSQVSIVEDVIKEPGFMGMTG